MHINTKVQKWGNSLALRLSGALKDIPNFSEGDEVAIDITVDGFSVKKFKPSITKKMPFTEQELLQQLNHENCHSELLAPLYNIEYE